jgi:hypothetical protein
VVYLTKSINNEELEALRKERKRWEAQAQAQEDAILEKERFKRSLEREKERIIQAQKRSKIASTHNSFTSKLVRGIKKTHKTAKRISKEIKK